MPRPPLDYERVDADPTERETPDWWGLAAIIGAVMAIVLLVVLARALGA